MSKPPSTSALVGTAIARLIVGVLVIGALVFVPAGTLRFWQAWVWLAVLILPIAGLGVALAALDPQLLERRMRTGERERPQKNVIGVFILAMFVIFIVPGLDRRFGWSAVPAAVVILSDLAILAGYVVFILTIRENRFASRVIEVQDEQKVVVTGPYSLIRHPMYLAMILVLCPSPLALGSWWGALPTLAVPLLLAIRIVNEERVLREGLAGYDDYTRKVRYRLVPFLW
jgi:protein-S-isoprenylcysteine O-methyltransferase Ste14